MKKIDGYLSRLAQGTWPTALVEQAEDGEYSLTRPGQEPLGLGEDSTSAHQGLTALLRAYRREQK